MGLATINYWSTAFRLRVDIRALLLVLGRTVRYVASCRLSYIQQVVSFLLDRESAGRNGAEACATRCPPSVHVRLRVLATSRGDNSQRVNWPFLLQNLVARIKVGPTSSNQFEILGQVPVSCSSKRFVWTEKVPAISPRNQPLRVNSSAESLQGLFAGTNPLVCSQKEHTEIPKIPKFGVNRPSSKQDTAN